MYMLGQILKKFILILSIIFFTFPAYSYAQTGGKIKGINFVGMISLSPLIAYEIANLGDEINEAKINEAIKAFYKQGYFEDIYVENDDGHLTFHFKEKAKLISVEIKGYGNEQETKDLTRTLDMKKGDPYDEFKEKQAVYIIKSALEAKGLYASIVEVEKRVKERGINITFRVNKGSSIIIRKSVYEGATLAKSDIESLSANKERHPLGFLPWWAGGELRVKELDLDNLRIQDVYLRHGYLDAIISNPLLRADFNSFNATLMYKINEGTRYKVKDTKVIFEDEGKDGDVFIEEDFKKSLLLKSKDFFNIETMRQDSEIIRFKIMDKGYAYARINPDLDKDEVNSLVDVSYRINIGNKIKIRDVLVQGNLVTQDRIVRRELLMAPGDYYNLTDIKLSENSLRRLGYFETVHISELRVSDEEMDILVEVKEGRTGELSFGLGWGSYDGLTGNFSLRERNLFGTGIGVGFAINYSAKNQSYEINLNNPRFLDSNYSSSVGVSYSKSIRDKWSEESIGFGLGVGRYFGNLSLNLSYNFSFNVLYGKGSKVKDEEKDENQKFYATYHPKNGLFKSSLTPSISYDNTDDYYFPKNGVIFHLSPEFSLIGGHTKFIKTDMNLGLYYHLQNIIPLDFILRSKTHLGYIFDLGNDEDKYSLPFSDAYYAGGVGSIRGYQTYSLTPTVKFNNNYRDSGGHYIATTALELSYGLLDSLNMRVSAFYDIGAIGLDKRKLKKLGSENTQSMFRQSWGFTIEWVSPIGPLVFVVPFAIKPKKDDFVSNFEFTMGTRF